MTLMTYECMHSLNKWQAQEWKELGVSSQFSFFIFSPDDVEEPRTAKCGMKQITLKGEKRSVAEEEQNVRREKSFVKQKNAFPGKQISFLFLLAVFFCIFKSGFAKLAQRIFFLLFVVEDLKRTILNDIHVGISEFSKLL